jgi:hypothetical protein
MIVGSVSSQTTSHFVSTYTLYSQLTSTQNITIPSDWRYIAIYAVGAGGGAGAGGGGGGGLASLYKVPVTAGQTLAYVQGTGGTGGQALGGGCSCSGSCGTSGNATTFSLCGTTFLTANGGAKGRIDAGTCGTTASVGGNATSNYPKFSAATGGMGGACGTLTGAAPASYPNAIVSNNSIPWPANTSGGGGGRGGNVGGGSGGSGAAGGGNGGSGGFNANLNSTFPNAGNRGNGATSGLGAGGGGGGYGGHNNRSFNRNAAGGCGGAGSAGQAWLYVATR